MIFYSWFKIVTQAVLLLDILKGCMSKKSRLEAAYGTLFFVRVVTK
jgi:hypothetical protein